MSAESASVNDITYGFLHNVTSILLPVAGVGIAVCKRGLIVVLPAPLLLDVPKLEVWVQDYNGMS